MRGIARALFELFSKIWIEVKNVYLGFIKSRRKHKIRVFRDKSYFFCSFGDLLKMLYCNSHLVRFNKGFEFETLEHYVSLIENGDVILDIGANIGLFSIIGSEIVGDTGKIYAFEPSPKTFAALNENLTLNNCNNVVSSTLALSNSNGRADLIFPEEGRVNHEQGDLFTHLSYSEEGMGNDLSGNVQTCTIDSFMETHGVSRIDLIKIDIEGAEKLCFEGARELFSSENKPIIIFELFEPFCARFGTTSFQVLKYLDQFGYELSPLGNYQWIAK